MQPSPSVSADSLSVFASQFRPLAEEARRIGDFIDVWNVAGLGRDEIRNAAVLAWLLDARREHGRGSAILQALMHRLAAVARGAFPFPTEITGDYSVLTEAYPLSDTGNRVDIVIETLDTVIFVEVKVDASEGDRQLERYVDLARSKALAAGKRYFGVIFFSPHSHRATKQLPRHPNIVVATWKEVARAIEMVVRTGPIRSENFSDRLLTQFVRHIHQF